jgi:hypothetical protein
MAYCFNIFTGQLDYYQASSAISVTTEVLTDSGDHQNFGASGIITTVLNAMNANSGKGIPSSEFIISGTTLTLTSPDVNLASDGIQLKYSSAISVTTEVLTDSGDHQNFGASGIITTVIGAINATSGKGIPDSDFTISGTTLTLTSPDSNLASDGIQLTYN